MISTDTLVQSVVVLSALILSHWRIRERLRYLKLKVDKLEAVLEFLVKGRIEEPTKIMVNTQDEVTPVAELIKTITKSAGVIALVTGVGCARFSSSVTAPDGSVTKVSASTLFDSKSELAKLAAGQGARTNAQHITVGSLNQESATPTNINTLISDVVGAAIKAAKP